MGGWSSPRMGHLLSHRGRLARFDLRCVRQKHLDRRLSTIPYQILPSLSSRILRCLLRHDPVVIQKTWNLPPAPWT